MGFKDNKSSEETDVVKVMVVDDSAVIRGFLTRFIEEDTDIIVRSSAINGQMALDNMKHNTYDVIVLDIEMPVMDGLTALPKILKADPYVQVIIASTLSRENAAVTLKAFSMGAAECFAKPTSGEMSGSTLFRDSLVEKVRELGMLAKRKRARATGQKAPKFSAGKSKFSEAAVKPAISLLSKPFKLKQNVIKKRPAVIAVGSSTGGPQALLKFFADLGASKGVEQPIFITQHMPPTFTTILADHISKNSGLKCTEAQDGMAIEPRGIYLAQGGKHMVIKTINDKKVIKLDDGEPENFCKPAVDPMMRSIIEEYGDKVLGVIFTGMGADGRKSCEQLVEVGGNVIAQDEETSVVWGMPGAVAVAGICNSVLPLDKMAQEVLSYANMGGIS